MADQAGGTALKGMAPVPPLPDSPRRPRSYSSSLAERVSYLTPEARSAAYGSGVVPRGSSSGPPRRPALGLVDGSSRKGSALWPDWRVAAMAAAQPLFRVRPG